MQFGAVPPPELTVSPDRRDDVVVLRVRGDLDHRWAPVLRSALGQAYEQPEVPAIVLDLSDVDFCDSVGLSELIAALRRCEADGRRFTLAGVHGTVLRLLTITGLLAMFGVQAPTAGAPPQAPGPPEAPEAPDRLSPVP
ncbi:hypothetical protein Sru01_08030 [Sphaerisporangium rufum]|uniref:Anti-sigma factor antagonist n=1 Tax=Sphaerisporangium rufum TaxID=1381558 RepID=A0A919UWA1_9ACTN|nr:STAS domain-containing protein [Sphaerisporangium rufum]GII75821.1 hypothetical protein Sru01_08030 [Sphaerisporangium rufum]